MDNNNPCSIISFASLLALKLDRVHADNSHLNNNLNGLEIGFEYIFAIHDKNLKGLKGMSKLVLILRVEEAGDNLKHAELALSNFLGFVNEGRHHHKDIFLEIVGRLPIDVRGQRHYA